MIHPTGHPGQPIAPSQQAYARQRTEPPAPAVTGEPQPAGTPDAAELSSAALEHTAKMEQDGIREGLVARVRAQLAQGDYLTEAKIDGAINRLHGALEG